MVRENLSFRKNFGRDSLCEMWMAIFEEGCKAIKVGQRRSRPFNLHRLSQGLNAGVPHVSSHRTTCSCGTVGSPDLTAVH